MSRRARIPPPHSHVVPATRLLAAEAPDFQRALLSEDRRFVRGESSIEELLSLAEDRRYAELFGRASARRLARMLRREAGRDLQRARRLAAFVTVHLEAVCAERGHYAGEDLYLLNEAVLDVFERAPREELQAARCLLTRGLNLLCHGGATMAREAFVSAYTILEAAGDRHAAAYCLLGQADALRDGGMFVEAVAGYASAAESLSRVDGVPRSEIARCHLGRGGALRSLGRYQEALAAYARAMALFSSPADETQRARCHQGRANCLACLSHYADALLEYSTADALFTRHGRTVEAARCRLNRGPILRRLQRYEEAVADYDAAERLFRERALPYEEALCHLNRGVTRVEMGHIETALRDFEGGESRFRRCRRLDDVARCRTNRAAALARSGRTAEALRVYRTVNARHLHEDDRATFHHGYASARERHGTGERTAAGRATTLREYVRALQALEAGRRNGLIDEASLDHVSERGKVVADAARYALRCDDVAAAFWAMQHGKASLWPTLRHPVGGGFSGSDALRALREELVRALGSHGPYPDDWDEGVYRYGRAYLRAFQAEYANDRRENVERLWRPLPEDVLERVRSALPPGWALVDFWMPDLERVMMFSLSGAGVSRVTKSVDRPAFERAHQEIQRWRAAGNGPWKEGLQFIHDVLFREELPRFREEGVHGLYLVPHGPLCDIPLHAAYAGKDASGADVFLADEFDVAYLPSAALLPDLPAPDRSSGRGAAFGNPERGGRRTLPFAEWEVEEVARLAPDVRTWTGPEAETSAAVRAWDASLVYFACHGVNSAALTTLSHLRMADGPLLAHDILYRLPSMSEGAVVVLNGCRTGLRDEAAPAEAFGMMSAFLLAGAAAVLATQWVVDDALSALQTTRFVRSLVEGKPLATALRESQRHLRLQVTPEAIRVLCRETAQRFPEQEYPWETARINVSAMRAAISAGDPMAAHEHGRAVVKCLERIGRTQAERRRLGADFALPDVSRSSAHMPRPHRRAGDHPAAWAGYFLIGRVA